MTEQEWLNCEDPARMITLITKGFDGCIGVPKEKQKPFQYRASDYKLWKWINACREATKNKPGEWICHEGDEECDLHPIINTWSNSVYWSREYPLSLRANLLREVIGNPFNPIKLPEGPGIRCDKCGGPYSPLKRDHLPLMSGCLKCGRDGPFWATLELSKKTTSPILTWRDGLIPKTAQDIHDNEKWEEMGILADMCEDAGIGEQKCSKCKGRGELSCSKCSGEGCSYYGIMANDPCTAGDPCPDCNGKGLLDNQDLLMHLRGVPRVGQRTTIPYIHCPKCKKPGYRRHGMHFDHEYRCGECKIVWEPGERFVELVEYPVIHCRGCYVLDALTGRE